MSEGRSWPHSPNAMLHGAGTQLDAKDSIRTGKSDNAANDPAKDAQLRAIGYHLQELRRYVDEYEISDQSGELYGYILAMKKQFPRLVFSGQKVRQVVV